MAQWFVLLLTLIATSSTIASNDGLPAYDSYMVTVRWPPAICTPPSPCKSPSTNTTQWEQLFVLCGMWPYTINGSMPINCSGPAFNISMIPDTLIRNLSTAWPNLFGNNEDLWKCQWLKHGRCLSHKLVEYFSKAVQLYKRIKLNTIFSNRGILPSSTNLYPLSDIKSAVAAYTGFEPSIVCKGGGSSPLELEAIRFCFNLTNNYVSCQEHDIDCLSPNALIHWFPNQEEFASPMAISSSFRLKKMFTSPETLSFLLLPLVFYFSFLEPIQNRLRSS